MTAKPLKAGIGLRYIAPLVSCYVGLVFLAGPSALTWQSALQHGSFAGLLALAVLALQELPTRALKEILVHWRLRDRLPGSRAFSEHAQRDHRVDLNALGRLLNPMPATPREQNAVWYGWLKQTEDAAEVSEAHRRYLILRDTAVVSLMLAIVSVALLVLPGWRTISTVTLIAACAGAYAVLALSAQSMAARLVTTVIAIKLTRASPTSTGSGSGAAHQTKRGNKKHNN